MATAALALGLWLGLLGARALAAEVLTASMVIDANTGAVLQQENPDAPRHPASLTKMMTLYLVFNEIEQGRLSYDSTLTVSARAAGVAPSKLDLKEGEEISLLDAIKALVTKSANDMAVAVAERIGGSEIGFVRLMNERARQIGMRSTTFTNASGLPDPGQITTARDLLTLALRLQDDFPKQYGLFSLKAFTYRGKTYRTHNTLMHGFPGMDGIKTGYTRASGFNLVSSVHVDGKHLVAVVLGGATAAARNAHMRALLYRTLQQASAEKTRRPQAVLVARNETAAAPPPAPMAAPPPSQASRPPAAAPRAPSAADASQPKKPPPVLKPTVTDTPAPPARAAPPPATTSSAPDIAIAKVRIVTPAYGAAAPSAPSPAQSISVPPPADAASEDAAADAATEESQAAAAPVPKLDLMALRAAISSEARPAEAAPAAAPGSIDDLISTEASAASAPPAAPAETGGTREERVALVAEEASAAPTKAEAPRARASSSLDAQAAALGGPTAPPSAPAARAAATGSGGGYEIQIGAYSSAAEAESRLSAARGLAPALLGGRQSVALPAQSGGRQVFRARFASFDQSAAAAACAELKKRSLDCIVVRAD